MKTGNRSKSASSASVRSDKALAREASDRIFSKTLLVCVALMQSLNDPIHDLIVKLNQFAGRDRFATLWRANAKWPPADPATTILLSD